MLIILKKAGTRRDPLWHPAATINVVTTCQRCYLLVVATITAAHKFKCYEPVVALCSKRRVVSGVRIGERCGAAPLSEMLLPHPASLFCFRTTLLSLHCFPIFALLSLPDFHFCFYGSTNQGGETPPLPPCGHSYQWLTHYLRL